MDNWIQYMEHLEFFFTANGITVAEKESTLLAVVGLIMHKLLCSMLAPEKSEDVSFEGMAKALLEYYSP